MLVKMINGTFGYREKTPEGYSMFVTCKSRVDPPFEVDEEVGLDLIDRGVAVSVESDMAAPDLTASGSETANPDNAQGTEGEDPAANGIDPDPEAGMIPAYLDGADLETMTVAQLKALAEEMGLSTGGTRKKADLIDLITSETVYVDEEEDGPPDLTAEDPV